MHPHVQRVLSARLFRTEIYHAEPREIIQKSRVEPMQIIPAVLLAIHILVVCDEGGHAAAGTRREKVRKRRCHYTIAESSSTAQSCTQEVEVPVKCEGPGLDVLVRAVFCSGSRSERDKLVLQLSCFRLAVHGAQSYNPQRQTREHLQASFVFQA